MAGSNENKCSTTTHMGSAERQSCQYLLIICQWPFETVMTTTSISLLVLYPQYRPVYYLCSTTLLDVPFSYYNSTCQSRCSNNDVHLTTPVAWATTGPHPALRASQKSQTHRKPTSAQAINDTASCLTFLPFFKADSLSVHPCQPHWLTLLHIYSTDTALSLLHNGPGLPLAFLSQQKANQGYPTVSTSLANSFTVHSMSHYAQVPRLQLSTCCLRARDVCAQAFHVSKCSTLAKLKRNA